MNVFFRNLTRSYRHFFLPGITVLLGIAVLVFTSSIITSTRSYISTRSAELLGGDIKLDSSFPIDIQELPDIKKLQQAGATIESIMIINAMVISSNNESLTRVKIVQENYPLLGTVETASDSDFAIPAANGILLDQDSAETLSVNIGDKIQLGNADFQVVDIILSEPDLGGGFFSFGGKAILSETGFQRSGINRMASRTSYELLIKLPEAMDLAAVRKNLAANLDKGAIDIDFADEDSQSLPDAARDFGKLLNIVSLMLLFLAIAAIYLSSGQYLEEQKKIIAIYRAFGKNVLAIICEHAGVIIVWCGFYGLLGGGVGIWAANITIDRVTPALGIPLELVITPSVIILGPLLAMGIGLCGSVLRLVDIFTISPRTLISGSGIDQHSQVQIRKKIAATLATLLLFLILLFVLRNLLLALSGTFGFILITAITSFFIGFVLKLLGKSKKFFKRFYALRTTLSFFLRPQGGTSLSLSMLLISFFAVSSVWIIAQSLLMTLEQNIQDEAPAMIILDVQQDQVEIVEEQYPKLELYPVIRARIIEKNDEDIRTSAEGEILRPFNLSFSDTPDPREKVIEGTYWQPGSSENEVSVEQGYAERFNLELGDKMLFDIAGIPLTARVTSIREFDTTEFRPWFAFLFPVEVLQDAPVTYFGFMDVEPESVPGIRKKLVQQFPNVSILSTQEIADKIIPTLNSISAATKLFAGIMLINGFLVLSILLAASSRQRKKDFYILEMFGASKSWIIRTYSLEIMLSVAIAWIFGFLFSLTASFALITFYFKLETMALPFAPLGIGLLVALLAILVRGKFLGKMSK